MMKLILSCLFMGQLFFLGAGFAQSSIHETFFKAHEAYDQGLYEDAIKLYPQDIPSGEIYYNLGNFYYKMGKTGEALYNYRLAKIYMPRDADLTFNLNYVREKVVDKIEDRRSVIKKTILASPTSVRESFILVSLLSLVFWPLSVFLIYRRSEWLLWPRGVAGVLLMLSLFNLFSSYYISKYAFGVVDIPEIQVYSGVGKGDVVLFTLHEGVEFEVLDRYEDWYQIQLLDGKKGWLRADKVKARFERT